MDKYNMYIPSPSPSSLSPSPSPSPPPPPTTITPHASGISIHCHVDFPKSENYHLEFNTSLKHLCKTCCHAFHSFPMRQRHVAAVSRVGPDSVPQISYLRLVRHEGVSDLFGSSHILIPDSDPTPPLPHPYPTPTSYKMVRKSVQHHDIHVYAVQSSLCHSLYSPPATSNGIASIPIEFIGFGAHHGKFKSNYVDQLGSRIRRSCHANSPSQSWSGSRPFVDLSCPMFGG